MSKPAASARGAARRGPASAAPSAGLSLGIAGQRSDGIDSFSGDGERDGYRNLAGARRGPLSARATRWSLGASGFALGR